MTQWTVNAAADRFRLGADNRGALVFTVTNPGPDTDTAVFDIVPDERPHRAWFSVEQPQRSLAPNETASFLVRLAVPPGTPGGRHHMKGIAYSANTAPEESSRSSGRVAYQLSGGRARRRWPVVVAILAVLAAGGGVFWVLQGQQPVQSAEPSPATSPATSPNPAWTPAVVTIEAEKSVSQATYAGPGKASATALRNSSDLKWSGSAAMLVRGTAPGDSVTITFAVPATGDYVFEALRARGPNYCVTAFRIDDRPVGEAFDGYLGKYQTTGWAEVGRVPLTAGKHQLTVVIAGSTQLTKGYSAVVDAVRFTQLPVS